VVDTRYQAGRFGSGFKPRPKSDAGIREIPLAPLVVEAIRRQLPPDADSNALVFAGPGGGNGVPYGTRTTLSRHGFRRLYQNATHRARSDLGHLQLRGPHDLRHSFSTWLEDEGIPARVIDELMGHQRSRRGELEGGSRIGARYRHTTPEMAPGSSKRSTADWRSLSRWRKQSPQLSWTRAIGSSSEASCTGLGGIRAKPLVGSLFRRPRDGLGMFLAPSLPQMDAAGKPHS